MGDNSQTNTLQNWHGDNTPMTPGQNGQPDVLSLLSGLIQKGLQASGGTDAQAATTQSTPAINPSTGLHDDQVKALRSVLAAKDKEDAQNALSMQGPDVLRQLADFHDSTAPSQNTDTPQITQQSVAQTTSTNSSIPTDSQATPGNINQNVMQQLLQVANQKPGILGSIFKGTFEENQRQQLDNLAGIQKIAGMEPLQQKDVQQAALDTQTKINQALTVPPTQAEKLQNAAAYAGYKTTALKDMLDNNNSSMNQQNDIIKNMQGYSSWFNKPFGAMPKEAQQAVTKLKQLQLERIAVSSELNKHQQLLASGGASTSPFKEGQVYTDAQGNTATFKNGKFQ